MDRLLERSLEILSATSPPALPIDTLSQALHRERMAVTESVLERSLANASPVRMVDPWLGANRALSRIRKKSTGRRRWVCLLPARTEWDATPSQVDRELTERCTPQSCADASSAQIDRAVRTLTGRIDLESPIELARWIRICGEGTRTNAA